MSRNKRPPKGSLRSRAPLRVNRRDLLKASAAAGAALMLPFVWTPRRAAAAIPGGTLDPGAVPKYQDPLVIPPAMPTTPGGDPAVDYYEIAVRQFSQQVLPTGMPLTTVWSYGSVNHPETFNYPAFTIEAKTDRPVRVKWINGLVDAGGDYLPHLLPVDPTLHWANPPGGKHRRDMRPKFRDTPGPYTGPVPIVTHVHGAHVDPESDGYPEAWYLPAANNIPAYFASTGTYFDIHRKISSLGARWRPGAAVFQYRNDQRATTLWYHDHTLGMTRVNVYAGPAGFYLLRGGPDDLADGVLPGPAPGVGADPFGTFFEIPIAIQDRSFNADGSLFFPSSREFFDGFAGPYIPDSDISPIWNPEFFGNMMVVNGRTWPYLNVQRRRYRFRFLNGCNARFLILKFSDPRVQVWQIGAEGGFLPAPVHMNALNGGLLLIALAERADVIVDFSNVPAGKTVTLLNLGPDEPFGGGTPGVDFAPSDPATTGQVMQFRVERTRVNDASAPPAHLALPALTPVGHAAATRQVSLNEAESQILPGVGPEAARLGTVNSDGSGNPLEWSAPVTENPALGATEVWEIHNFTEDAHPIHVHMVQFQVVNRQPMGGSPRPPEAWETGFKDTVIAYPGEITRIKANFDIAGLYVWHCHIIDHEDNEMMRPYRVG